MTSNTARLRAETCRQFENQENRFPDPVKVRAAFSALLMQRAAICEFSRFG